MKTENIGAMLTACYDIACLSEKEQIKYWLINARLDKVSNRLKTEHASLRAKGKKLSADMFKHLIYRDNPFLKLIENHGKWQGKYIPVPLVIKA